MCIGIENLRTLSCNTLASCEHQSNSAREPSDKKPHIGRGRYLSKVPHLGSVRAGTRVEYITCPFENAALSSDSLGSYRDRAYHSEP
jgi:hypothetical protein